MSLTIGLFGRYPQPDHRLGFGRLIGLLRRPDRQLHAAHDRGHPLVPYHSSVDGARALPCRSTGRPKRSISRSRSSSPSLAGHGWRASCAARCCRLREEDFVLAAQLAGASDRRVIFRHLIPSVLRPYHRYRYAGHARHDPGRVGLSFLNLGLRPPLISWGVLLQEAQNLESLRQLSLAARSRRLHCRALCSPSTSSAMACVTPPIPTRNEQCMDQP